jgi:hypothetical protein
MADDRVTIGGALVYGWTLWSGNWRRIWPALALNSLAAAAACTAAFASNQLLALGADLIGLITQIVVAGAVYRIALGDLHRDDAAFAQNPSGVHWRAAEWRMLAAYLLRGLFVLIIAALVLIAILALTFGLASAKGVKITAEIPTEMLQQQMGPVAMVILSACLAAALGALIFVQLRLLLVLPATVDRKKISVLSSWRLTRGLSFHLLGALVAIWVPLVASGILISSVLITAAGGSETSIPPVGALAAAVILGVLIGGVANPMTAAVLAYFYRGVRERG